jgi:hypothetical protein
MFPQGFLNKDSNASKHTTDYTKEELNSLKTTLNKITTNPSSFSLKDQCFYLIKFGGEYGFGNDAKLWIDAGGISSILSILESKDGKLDQIVKITKFPEWVPNSVYSVDNVGPRTVRRFL